MTKRIIMIVSMFFVLVLVLSACGGSQPATTDVVADGDVTLRRQSTT